jgi:hypothetical protein
MRCNTHARARVINEEEEVHYEKGRKGGGGERRVDFAPCPNQTILYKIHICRHPTATKHPTSPGWRPPLSTSSWVVLSIKPKGPGPSRIITRVPTQRVLSPAPFPPAHGGGGLYKQTRRGPRPPNGVDKIFLASSQTVTSGSSLFVQASSSVSCVLCETFNTTSAARRVRSISL